MKMRCHEVLPKPRVSSKTSNPFLQVHHQARAARHNLRSRPDEVAFEPGRLVETPGSESRFLKTSKRCPERSSVLDCDIWHTAKRCLAQPTTHRSLRAQLTARGPRIRLRDPGPPGRAAELQGGASHQLGQARLRVNRHRSS